MQHLPLAGIKAVARVQTTLVRAVFFSGGRKENDEEEFQHETRQHTGGDGRSFERRSTPLLYPRVGSEQPRSVPQAIDPPGGVPHLYGALWARESAIGGHNG